MNKNCNPNVWRTILRVAIAVLSAILGAIFENQTDLVTNISNIF